MEVFNILLVFFLGASIGSFLNVVIHRLPRNVSIVSPRSSCPKCKKLISWYENIPIFSYIFLKAKCSKCDEKISIRYFLVEIITSICFLTIYIKFGHSIEVIYYWIVFSLLIALSFIDFEYKAVPSILLFITFLSSFLFMFNGIEVIKNALLISGGIYILNYILTFYVQEIKSKLLKDESLKTQVALGEGDIPIFFLIGMIFSLKGALFAIFLSALFAIIPSVINLFYKKDIQTPFIPFLSLGIFTQLVFEVSSRF